MKKGLVVLIIIGSVTLLAGGAMLGIAISKGVFTNNSLSKGITQTYDLNDSFNKIDIDLTTANLTFKPAEDEKGKVVSVETEKYHHTAEVSNDTLIIKEQDDREWYEKWFSNFGKMEVTVYLPVKTYSDLKIDIVTGDVSIQDSFSFTEQSIKATTGDIKISNVSGANSAIEVTTGAVELSNYNLTGTLNAKTTTGDYAFTNVTCKKAELETTNGHFNLNSFIVDGNLKISGVTSDIDFYNCDAQTLDIHTTTGNVKGNLLTPKDFHVHTTTGESKVYSTEGAPRCNIETTTGDIVITIGAK